MSTIIAEKDLPADLTAEQAVEAAYSRELAEVASKLQRGLPCLIECDKDLVPFAFINLRMRLREAGMRCVYLDGRPRENEQQGPVPMGLMGTMIAQLREAVRGATQDVDSRGNPVRRVIVLPHLDLLTTSSGGLTGEAREVIVLLYENPEIVWLGFKDPSFPLPKVIDNLFPHRTSILGIGRNRLRYLVTQREARKFGRQFNPWALYKYVSGVNAVRLRRLLETLEGEDYPADARQAYRQLRQATLTGALEIPEVSLDRDIGGYEKVKKRLRQEILDVLTRRDSSTNEEDIARLEELLPRGMIFWGPPGTGKTYFAKAMAASIGAAITIVSGPELKSKWVGESLPYEEEVFVILNGQARRMPIGELVEQHSNDDVRTWTVRDDGSALLSPVTGFLKHKGPDYIDVLVTETGRQVRVTGGHSLFVRDANNQLTEVFAEEVEPGTIRVAVPLFLKAPETVREINLIERLGEREDVRVQGSAERGAWSAERANALPRGARSDASAAPRSALRAPRLRPSPVTLAELHRQARAEGTEIDPAGLSLYCWHRGKSMPAVLPLTPEFGEFLGRWVADGCFHRTGVRIAVHQDEADQVEGLCRRLFGHVTRYVKPEGGRGVDLVINSTLLHYVLKDALGMCDGSGRKRVPADVFLAPLPVVAGFLRGYFSGDGTFNGKYVEATTTSRGLADDVMTLLQYFGIAARCRTKAERNGAPAYRVRFIWTEFLRRFADHIGFADARRNDALRAYLDGIKLKRDLQTPARHITNDVLWDRVVEKRREPYAREHVYDLSVPETERFVAGFGNVLVHNSEENLRQVFHKARQSAPSIIVFDELDSFAMARGTYTGSGVEHSMVNQLLTEMDGFHKEELVFVVGTTNFVESLDPALLRPGRFEFHLHIPYPEPDDRREILAIYNKKMRLQMSDETIDFAVRRTGRGYLTPTGTPFSGDHLNALCRSVARLRLREARDDATTSDDVERALTEWIDRPKMTAAELRVLATHEAGHAVCSLFCEHAPPIERITIESDNPWAFGYVMHSDPAHRYIQTRNFYLDAIVVAVGAREAEKLLLNDLSLGAVQDLQTATAIARDLVEVHGMGNADVGLVRYRADDDDHALRPDLPEAKREAIDRNVTEILEKARERAAQILRDNRAVLETLRDLLIEHKTIDAKSLTQMVPSAPKKATASTESADSGDPKPPAPKKARKASESA